MNLKFRDSLPEKPNSATYVTKMSPDSAEEIFAVRRVLEAFAVEEVSRLATPDQIQNLERLYLEFLDAARARYTRLFLREDFSLHEMIWEISCNEYLQAALRRIVLPIFAYTTIHIVSRRAFDLLQDALSHLPLLEAIKSKDPAAARRALLVALDDWLSDIREYVFVSWKDKVRSFNRFRMNIIRKATSSFPTTPGPDEAKLFRSSCQKPSHSFVMASSSANPETFWENGVRGVLLASSVISCNDLTWEEDEFHGRCPKWQLEAVDP